MDLSKNISKKQLEEIFMEWYGKLPQVEFKRFPFKFRIVAGEVVGDCIGLNEGDFMLTLPPLSNKAIFINNEINYNYLMYDILIYVLKFGDQKRMLEKQMDSSTFLQYALIFLYLYISEDEESTAPLDVILHNLREEYERMLLVTPSTEMWQLIKQKSIGNGPFDYVTDGVDIYQVNEQNPPF